MSVDLDLFTPASFDAGELEAFLSQRYGFQTAFRRPDTLKGMIDGVKIDCIAHKYAYLRQPYAESGIRLYSIDDIVAMKLDIVMLNFEYDWKQIARRLKEMTVRQEHIFSQWPLKEQKRPVAEDKDMTSMKRGRKR